ncbi:MAG TPA: formate dehydrogenase accessory sulfurtransferase FdhD [Candidatus Binataceae bacterium]|jgi:FdhD protein
MVRSRTRETLPSALRFDSRLVEVNAWRYDCASIAARADSIAIEEPLEMRLAGRRFTLTMRTPGHDHELAAGFLFAEGFIENRDELGEIRGLRDPSGRPQANALDVILNVSAEANRTRLQRNFAISSSCGVCGKSSIDALHRRLTPIDSPLTVQVGTILSLPAAMRGAQEVFASTGGLHAAALFDSTGALKLIREDVGRHNAVDKVVGHLLMRTALPLSDSILLVSGRVSFEIVQKAAAAGIPILTAISAPSSLAIDLADSLGVTLIGFLRESSMNIYTHPRRVLA